MRTNPERSDRIDEKLRLGRKRTKSRIVGSDDDTEQRVNAVNGLFKDADFEPEVILGEGFTITRPPKTERLVPKTRPAVIGLFKDADFEPRVIEADGFIITSPPKAERLVPKTSREEELE